MKQSHTTSEAGAEARSRRCFSWSLMVFAFMLQMAWQTLLVQGEGIKTQWWAVQPVQRPAIPSLKNDTWSINPIDQFVNRKLRAAGLKPSPQAERSELIRRIYYDLIGLPPSPEAVQRFSHDSNPEAWQNLIEELLNSPHYGERWGQHWLDVTRWAESDGYRQDAFRPHAWPYRDYVIDSINKDKPYDTFVKEQLAGDEMAPHDPDIFIGTAYLRNGIYEYNQRNVQMHWELIVDELTSLTGEAFMGVGIGCAKCHDHKFDPIPQEDYYKIKAMLAPVSWKFDVSLATPAQQKRYTQQLEVWKEATEDLRKQIDAIVEPRIQSIQQEALIKFPEEIQAIFAKKAKDRSPYEQQLMDLAKIQLEYERENFNELNSIKGEAAEKLKTLRKALNAYATLKPEKPTPAFVASDVGRRAPRVMLKNRSGEREIPPGFLSVLESTPLKIPSPEDASTTGRRTMLAEWLTDEAHPLTPRVMANRIWQKHFKEGLVSSPNDFGHLGQAPSHPELLDWLAAEFMDSGWSLKHMHRMILQSATYRQTTRREPGPTESHLDPLNRLLWRYPPKRLDAAQIRDTMLYVSGELDITSGGQSVKGNQPRRSVYVRKVRNSPDELLKGFDSPSGFNSTPVRDATATPGQALLMVNGDWIMKRAEAFARQLQELHGRNMKAWINHAFEKCYGRVPDSAEMKLATAFLENSPENLEPAEILPDLCQILLNSNEFLYLH